MMQDNAERRLILKLSSVPLIFLIVLLVTPLPFYFRGIFNYLEIMPLIIFLSGIIVIAVGAFWDFGARIYIKEVMDSRMKITDEDIIYINKQQLKMTIVYVIIGFIYFITALIIYSL